MSNSYLKQKNEGAVDNNFFHKNILNANKDLDEGKNMNSIVDEIFEHYNIKSKVSRNMLQKLYEEDPLNFHENKDVQRVLRNNVAWPKGYIPTHIPVIKIVVPISEDQKRRNDLREKHDAKMKPFSMEFIDDLVMNPEQICEIENAMGIYKQNAWRANFAPIRIADKEKQEARIAELRAELEHLIIK